ncbi:MAG: beta-lactamase family protein [Xanthomonadales bacterium]|nr:beta-lactamase family protein [Xanthomonadales bacterium]
MTIKSTISLLALLVLVVLIYISLPLVFNPDPEYQTELKYGKPLPIHIQSVLTPTVVPKRIRSIMVLKDEKVLYEYGPTDKIMFGASTRKSFLALLYGIAIEKGLIDINKTLAELGIDENTPLSDQEKTATIRDLLMWRSGIYLPAKGEHDDQITMRPSRDSHKPGTYFFANNFDANALGTIFIQETGYSIGGFMEEYLAKPLGMQDFDSDNVIMGNPWFWPDSIDSKHDMYNMYLSTRDFARIGAMVANRGRWNGAQVVPENWVIESTKPHSDLTNNHRSYGRYDAFGYVWFIDNDTGTVWTDGYGGHFMLIDLARNLTLVERNFTGNSYLSTGLWLMNGNFDQSLGSLIKAHQLIVQSLDGEK